MASNASHWASGERRGFDKRRSRDDSSGRCVAVRVSRTTNEFSPEPNVSASSRSSSSQSRGTAAAVFENLPGRSVREIRHEHRAPDGWSRNERAERDPLAVERDHRKAAIDAGLSLEDRLGAALHIPDAQFDAARSCGEIRERVPVTRHGEITDEACAAGQTSRGAVGPARPRVDPDRPHVRIGVDTDEAQSLARRPSGRTRILPPGVMSSGDPIASNVVGEIRCRHTWTPCRPAAVKKIESPVQAIAIEMMTRVPLSRLAKHARVDRRSAIHRHDPAIAIG